MKLATILISSCYAVVLSSKVNASSKRDADKNIPSVQIQPPDNQNKFLLMGILLACDNTRLHKYISTRFKDFRRFLKSPITFKKVPGRYNDKLISTIHPTLSKTKLGNLKHSFRRLVADQSADSSQDRILARKEHGSKVLQGQGPRYPYIFDLEEGKKGVPGTVAPVIEMISDPLYGTATPLVRGFKVGNKSVQYSLRSSVWEDQEGIVYILHYSYNVKSNNASITILEISKDGKISSLQIPMNKSERGKFQEIHKQKATKLHFYQRDAKHEIQGKRIINSEMTTNAQPSNDSTAMIEQKTRNWFSNKINTAQVLNSFFSVILASSSKVSDISSVNLIYQLIESVGNGFSPQTLEAIKYAKEFFLKTFSRIAKSLWNKETADKMLTSGGYLLYAIATSLLSFRSLVLAISRTIHEFLVSTGFDPNKQTHGAYITLRTLSTFNKVINSAFPPALASLKKSLEPYTNLGPIVWMSSSLYMVLNYAYMAIEKLAIGVGKGSLDLIKSLSGRFLANQDDANIIKTCQKANIKLSKTPEELVIIKLVANMNTRSNAFNEFLKFTRHVFPKFDRENVLSCAEKVRSSIFSYHVRPTKPSETSKDVIPPKQVIKYLRNNTALQQDKHSAKRTRKLLKSLYSPKEYAEIKNVINDVLASLPKKPTWWPFLRSS